LICSAEKGIWDEKLTVYISLINTFKNNDPKTNNRGTLGTKIGDEEYQKFQQQNIRRLCNYKTSQPVNQGLILCKYELCVRGPRHSQLKVCDTNLTLVAN
jgi:hypothetical protein